MRKRYVWLIVAILCATLFLSISTICGASIPAANWGLSFQTQGQAPHGPATSVQLAKYDAAYLGDTREKVLYLTFDAGYENGCTGKILDVLEKHQVPAAFFLVGNYIEKNPDLVRRMVSEGHIVGNHTMHHYDMSKISDRETFAQELKGLEDLFREKTGKDLPRSFAICKFSSL